MGWYQRRVHGDCLVGLSMKSVILVAACLTAVLAVPNGRRLRPEEHWRPSVAKDLSKYRPRGEMFPIENSLDKTMTRRNLKRNSIIPSHYNLEEECGIEGPPSKTKIVGGDEAVEHQFPWIVALFIDHAWFCGGALISEKWVLTAAHCVDGANYFEVMAGAHNVRASSEDHRIVITSYKGFTHEAWDRYTLKNDIAMIELPEAVQFNDYIKPTCLPEASNTADVGDLLSVIGWGKPSDQAASISPVLRMVHDIPVMSNADCNAYYGIVGAGIVCLDTEGGRSSCNGDSGGPLISKEEQTKTPGQKWTQVGVVSFGSRAGCEVGAPAGFTRTAYYREWITTNTGV